MFDGELGSFIRSRREAVRPVDVGLPESPRRRTPGLRRAELATLADISIDYLTRLEQGRDTHPSSQVLASLAAALQMGEADLDHLRRLAVVSNGTELCPAARLPATGVQATVRSLLDALEPAPAFVVNAVTDLLAWTEGYDRLARPLGILDTAEPNLLWFTFVDGRARTAYVDWADVADEQVATLRSGLSCHPDADPFAARLAEAAGASFNERWENPPRALGPALVRGIAHPEVGVLRLAVESLDLPDLERQRLVVHLPADTTTAAGLDRLSGPRTRSLRVVAAG